MIGVTFRFVGDRIGEVRGQRIAKFEGVDEHDFRVGRVVNGFYVPIGRFLYCTVITVCKRSHPKKWRGTNMKTYGGSRREGVRV